MHVGAMVDLDPPWRFVWSDPEFGVDDDDPLSGGRRVMTWIRWVGGQLESRKTINDWEFRCFFRGEQLVVEKRKIAFVWFRDFTTLDLDLVYGGVEFPEGEQWREMRRR